jgi:hypothetical protein
MSNRGLEKHRADKQKKVNAVLDAFVKRCSVCDVASSKRRLFTLPEGDICAHCAGETVGKAGLSVYELEAAHKVHLETEKNKPKPEGYGGWA